MSYLRLFTFLTCLCFCNSLLSAPKYTISEFDIQQLEQKIDQNIIRSYACQINNLGQVVGLCCIQENHWSTNKCAVYIWDKDTGFRIIYLDEHNKKFPVINDNGVVSWTTYEKSKSLGESNQFAYLWYSKINEVRRFGNNHSIVKDINNRNEVLLTPYDRDDAQLWAIDPKNVPSSFSKYNLVKKKNSESQCAMALNNLSQIVGVTRLVNHISNGFLWDPKGFEDLGFDFLPSDINDYGEMVGTSVSGKCALLLKKGEMIIIHLSAGASSINNLGEVVGHMGKHSFGPEQKAFVYTDNITYELFSLIVDNNGWTSLNCALNINDSGQIVGFGLYKGKVTGFLLNPIRQG